MPERPICHVVAGTFIIEGGRKMRDRIVETVKPLRRTAACL